MEKGFFLPTKYFLTAGSSYGDTELVAFDLALINAGIANLNLIKLSSILAPMCQRIPKTKIELGAFIGVAYAKNVGTHTGETISSAIAIGHPSDKSKASLIMEYSSSMNAVESDRVVREMVKQGMANRGLELGSIESIFTECNINQISYAVTFAAVVEL